MLNPELARILNIAHSYTGISESLSVGTGPQPEGSVLENALKHLENASPDEDRPGEGNNILARASSSGNILFAWHTSQIPTSKFSSAGEGELQASECHHVMGVASTAGSQGTSQRIALSPKSVLAVEGLDIAKRTVPNCRTPQGACCNGAVCPVPHRPKSHPQEELLRLTS